MSADISRKSRAEKIILIGADRKQIVEKRFQAAGCEVVRATDHDVALDITRHQLFDTAVLLSQGSLLNTAETVINLRDRNRSMEIIILVERRVKNSNRFLQQLLHHPIEGTNIMTRRQLQKQLQAPDALRTGALCRGNVR
jgi:DNA-binding response OmpR family regulator